MRVRRRQLFAALLLLTLPPAPASAADTVVAYLSGTAYDFRSDSAFLLVVCELHTSGRLPASTSAYCRVNSLPPDVLTLPASPSAVQVWPGRADTPVRVCAGGWATYGDLSVITAAEDCATF